MIKIESNVPPPPSRTIYPFKDMKVGDSFVVPHSKARAASVLASVKNHNKTYNTSVRVATRRENGTNLRVWRTE